jgi:ribosomal protein S18 acetylase RimI-like enzyme
MPVAKPSAPDGSKLPVVKPVLPAPGNPEFECFPQLSQLNLFENSRGFSQKIVLSVQSTPAGFATWHVTDGSAGVAQILELQIDPPHRRQGHGRRLLSAVVKQIEQYHQSHNNRLRQVWVMVRQKDEIGARAFLTDCGFHHVGSVPALFRTQDGLIYSRAAR